MSRIYPEKRIELQLDVFRRLPRERLVLVGGYSAGDFAERYLARLKPPPNVTLVGELPEARLTDLYARCRGFLTTAVDEDFGITPVEAMAAGKCVLATDEGGYQETVLLPSPPAHPVVDAGRDEEDRRQRDTQEGGVVDVGLQVGHVLPAVREGHDEQEGEEHLHARERDAKLA